MHKQNLVKQTLSENLDRVSAVVSGRPECCRTEIARSLCEEFELWDAKGALQVGGCLKALRQLEAQGHFTLPAARGHSTSWSPRRLGVEVPCSTDVPGQVDRLEELAVVLVDADEDMKCWNELMIREHPLGGRPLVGRQLRYLVRCEYGIVGAVGFGAAALRLKARDEWIGWAEEQRQAYLDRVVCMSRFLIRPQIQCMNLASKVLSMSISSMAVDFEQKYGYAPWLLESFVDSSQYTGTSYKAANWQWIGQTAGRGRQDEKNEARESIKDVYVYVLDLDFRKHLGLAEKEPFPTLQPGVGLGREEWAQNEFSNAPLGDKRLTRRLITIARSKGEDPQASFLHGVRGKSSSTSGFYRFIDQPEESQVTMANILQPHRQRTLRRMNAHRQVLCIHDTTDLNFDSLNDCEGLGVIGKNQKVTSQGLSLHTSLVVTEADGLPLGILNAVCNANQLKPEHRGKDRRYIPIEDKDTYRWLTCLDQCRQLTRALPETRVIHVMDREADFFDLFHCWNRSRRDDLIIRAKNNRRTDTNQLMLDAVATSEVKHTIEVEIPRRSKRSKKASQKESPARPRRTASLALRYMPVAIKAPKHGLNAHKPDVQLWILHVKEEPTSADVIDPVDWFLLTSIPVESKNDAVKILQAYTRRWRIEEWHRVLKTGCRVEQPAHQKALRLERIIAINIVIAWRIQLMTLLGREMPGLPPQILFSDLELRILQGFSKTQPKLPQPDTLGNAVFLTAKMGGYLGRKNDPPPGSQVLWRGLTDLVRMAQGVRLVQRE